MSDDTAGEWLITGVGHDGSRPRLEVRLADDPSVKTEWELLEEMNLVITGPRRCIGARPPQSSSLIPCEQMHRMLDLPVATEPPTQLGTQCTVCRDESRLIPCLRCHGGRCTNPPRRDDCVQPDNHAVYLLAVTAADIKVGVTRWARRHIRVREQGAIAALIIGRADGQHARRLESLIIRHHDIPGVINAASHVEALAHPRDIQGAMDRLVRRAELIRRRWPREPWLDIPEVPDLPPPPQPCGHVHLLRLHPGESLRGPIHCVAGRIVVIGREDGDVALDLDSLIGYPVHVGEDAHEEHASYQMMLT